MSASPSQKIQAVLGADESTLRGELITLVVDHVIAQPLGPIVDRGALIAALDQGLTAENAQRIAERHVLPALERIASGVQERSDRVGDLFSKQAEDELFELVSRGEGPRFEWLDGAIDPEDLRQLIAPVTQQMLFQFTTRLPIPGLGGGSGGGIGGLVGRIGKQVQKSAGQLADVGRSMFNGVIRDFSQTATADFRVALKERMETPEGQAVVKRIRQRYLAHLFAVDVDTVVRDLMRLPRPEIAKLVALLIEHNRGQTLVRELFEQELGAVLDELSTRSIESLLRESGLYDATRAMVLDALEPGIKALVQSSAFGSWLDRVLTAAEQEPA